MNHESGGIRLTSRTLSYIRTIAVVVILLVLFLGYYGLSTRAASVDTSTGLLGISSRSNPQTDTTLSSEAAYLMVLDTKDPDIFKEKQREYEQAKAEAERQAKLARQREFEAKVARVEAFFESYGAELTGYGHILVRQSEMCGGNYRVLVGIAGSESGLGRVMYKQYNPFGYLNGVQYNNLEQALTELSCQVSKNHISVCGTDLYCLANRYAGPQDDQEHFISKVRWFMNQV